MKGVTYVVYAREYAGALLTHKCTRTRPLSDAGEDVRYLENLEAKRPQALVYGDVFHRITGEDGSTVQQALFERLQVIAVSATGRRSVSTDQWGPYQIVLAPGDYELWVERRGKPVTLPEKLTLRAGQERRLSFSAEYDSPPPRNAIHQNTAAPTTPRSDENATPRMKPVKPYVLAISAPIRNGALPNATPNASASGNETWRRFISQRAVGRAPTSVTTSARRPALTATEAAASATLVGAPPANV